MNLQIDKEELKKLIERVKKEKQELGEIIYPILDNFDLNNKLYHKKSYMKFKIRDIKKREYGPFEMEDIIHKIYPQTQIKFEGENKWQIAGHLKLFRDEFKKRKINSYLPKGRIGRSNYFGYSFIIYLLFAFLPKLLSFFNEHPFINSIIVARIIAVFWLVLFLIVLYAKFVFVVKRLHDLSLSGFWCILALPIIPIADLLLAFWPGTRGKNKYGHDPKYRPIIRNVSNEASNIEVKNVPIQKNKTKKSKSLGAYNFLRRYSSLIIISLISIFASIISGFYFKRLNTDITITAIKEKLNLDEIIKLYRLKYDFFNLEYFEYNWNAVILTFIFLLIILTFLKIYTIKYITKDKLIKLVNKIEGRFM